MPIAETPGESSTAAVKKALASTASIPNYELPWCVFSPENSLCKRRIRDCS